MSQPPTGPTGFAMPADPRFDPNDPLVSADFTGWWQRGIQIVRRGWRTLALVQVFALIPALALTPLIVATYADLRARREPFITAYLPSA